jgi:hypothetical protein
LHLLGLGMEALESEIRSAYRLLVKAWQPENFQDDPKLKNSAEAKLKDVQTAFDFLTLTSSERIRTLRPVYLSARLAAALAVPVATSDADAAAGGNTAPPPPSPNHVAPASAVDPNAALSPQHPQLPPSPPNLLQRFKTPLIVLALSAVLVAGGLIWSALSLRAPAGEPVAPVDGFVAKLRHKNPLVGLLAAFLNVVDPLPSAPAQHSAELSAPNAAPEASAPADAAAAGVAKTPQPGQSRSASRGSQTGPARHAHSDEIQLTPYITVGSTREEVLALDGTPTAATEDKLVYGRSELDLRNNTVVGWRIDPASPIRVKLWPHSYVDPALDFFSVGSTRDEVLKIQGTPTIVTEDQFVYGNSIVYFSNNRVVRWKSDPASATLWAR